MDAALFSQLSTLGSSVVLLFGIVLLWRRSLHAYIEAFRWQSLVLAALLVIVGHFGEAPELYIVAVVFLGLKAIFIPRYLERLAKRLGAERELAALCEHRHLAGDRRHCWCCWPTPSCARWYSRATCPRAVACRWRWG